jgi:hypothetical protein
MSAPKHILAYVSHIGSSIVLFHDSPKNPKISPNNVMCQNTYHLVLEEVIAPPSIPQKGIPGAQQKTCWNVCTSGFGVLQDRDITVK